ncbi:hypothetical protein ACFPYJ_03465 [Paenibacillus solisilvae]|uniref:NodB homology domain-containing protein n=1 Tax=Paenibacillus solisilvae TaxID=2486751 RepID=A0ABW0VQW4_9BACL
MEMATVGVLLDKRTAERRWTYGLNAFEFYIEEILSHEGISYRLFDDIDQLTESCDIAIAALAADNAETASRLWTFMEKGGTVISYAGLNAMASRLGCVWTGNSGAGYAITGSDFGEEIPIRFLNAQPWRNGSTCEWPIEESGTIMKDHPNGPVIGTARHTFKIGKGVLVRWAVDIIGTIIAMQQGSKPVLTDGIPAYDGTGPVNEGILKADDQVEMDWDKDRLYTETGAPYYAHPYADYWRKELIGHLLRVSVDKGMTLPFIGYWPDGVRHVAMISHDSDGNQDEHAETTLEFLRECGILSTWCIIEPGYSRHIYDRVKDAGHELAFHFNALDSQGGQWDEAEFNRQLSWLKDAADLKEVVSNKNHYTRFEGWGELFAWCEKAGILSDQTRGPSKKGNVGFLFGTCHPFFPIAWSNEKNRIYNVLEIGFLTQDLDLASHWADSSIVNPFLDRVRHTEGVAHFLFHQVHIHNHESVRKALRKVIDEARKQDYVFWTGKQVNDWTRVRRKLGLVSITKQDEIKISGRLEAQGAVALIPVPDSYEEQKDEQVEVHFGVKCKKQIIQYLTSYISGGGAINV